MVGLETWGARLQADGAGGAGFAPAGDAGAGDAEGAAQPQEGAERAFTQAEVDKAVASRLARERAKWQKELDSGVETARQEAERLAQMSADERAREQLRKVTERAERLEREKAEILLRQDTVDELLARDLPPAFADFLMGQDSKGTQARIQAFEEAYRAAVEAAVNSRLKGETPPAGDAGLDSFTAALRKGAGL